MDSAITQAKTATLPDEPVFPRVSVIVPFYNEEDFIGSCLESILSNDYPSEQLEILLIDGMSTDRSRQIAMEYAKKYSNIRLLNNPRRIQAAALNIGIKEAKGKIIVRMDAHTTYEPDYIQQCVTLLQGTNAANVGGLQRAVGRSYITNAIALATTSPFGVGDAHFRYAETEKWVDTVYLGAWEKTTLEALGGFNEEWVVNEDYELNYRLRESGGRILLSPRIRCQYHVRSSIPKLMRQYFRYGFWKVKTLVAHPASLRWRQLVPPAFVLAVLSSLVVLPFFWPAGISIPVLYLFVAICASFQCTKRGRLIYIAVLPIVFFTMHFCWGIGFLCGLFRFGLPKFTASSLHKALFRA